MAVTLLEAAKQMTGEAFRQSIVETFALSSPILENLPFDDIDGGSYRYNQEQELPGIAFRGVNEGYTESAAIINPQVETLAISGGDLDVDQAIVRMHGASTRATHENLKLKALAQQWHHTFFKGDVTTNAKEFDGLQARIPTTSSQYIDDGGVAALKLDVLDAAIDRVDDATHILMSQALRRQMSIAARTNSAGLGTGIERSQDEFGRQVMFYGGLPILTPNVNALATSYKGLSDTDANVYVVSMREGQLMGVQNGIPEVRDLGEQDSKPVVRTRFEWLASIVILHQRAVCRYGQINPALAVAST